MLTHANTRHNASARPQAPQIAPFRRNPGIHQLLGTTRVQPKLRVGAVNDPAEASYNADAGTGKRDHRLTVGGW